MLDEPGSFRSPLLAALPPEAAGRDPVTRRRRRAACLTVLAALAFLYLWAWFRWWPDHPSSRVVFRLWDHVYLPLKGYLYTFWRPSSLTFLLTASALVACGVLSWQARYPLTSGIHVRLARRFLRRPRGRRRVERWCRWRKRFVHRSLWRRMAGWIRRLQDALRWIGNRWTGNKESAADEPPPATAPSSRFTLLEEVIDHERRTTLDRLDAVDPAMAPEGSLLEETVDFSLISSRVLVEPPADEGDRLLAVSRLGQAWMRLELIRAARGGEDAVVRELGKRLEEELARALRPYLSFPGPPELSPRALASELGLVLGFTDAPSPEERRGRTVDGVLARRRLLDESRRRLERRWTFGQRRRSSIEIQAPRSRLAARLALDVALFAALRYGVPQIALAYLESLEGLRFMIMAAPAEAPDADLYLRAFGSLPRPFDYRVCAELADRELAASTDLAEALERRSEVLREDDVGLAAARNTELFMAAHDPRQARLPKALGGRR